MAGLLSRFTTFLPNTTILSNDHNQELNRIVNLLNGTTTNLKTVLKTSDAGDAPLELDQLSTGPILKLFQGGVLKASFLNDGSLSATNEIAATHPTAPHLRVVRTNPTARTVDVGIDTADNFVITTQGVNIPVSIAMATGVPTFVAIPVLPASDPTTDNQATRKAYVDATSVPFSINFFESDPSTATVATGDRPALIVPPGITGGVITQAHLMWSQGSAIATGDTVVYQFRKQSSGGAVTDWATVTLSSAESGIRNTYSFNIADQALTAGDAITYYISSRGTAANITPRALTISLTGTHKRIT